MIPDPFDDLVKSRFIEIFGTVEDSPYSVKAIKEITTVETGATPSRKNATYYGGSIPWIKTGELAQTYIYETEETITQAAINESNCKLFPENTVLLAMYGQGKTLGTSAICKISASTNQACAAIMPSDAYCPEFLLFQLKLQYNQIRMKAQGANQPNLNLSMVRNLLIICPPVNIQKTFVSFVKQVDKSKFVYQQIVSYFDDLVKSRFIEMFGHQDQNEKGFKESTIGESCIIRDSERIPVTSADREPGPYPYYGANGLQDYVKDYIFDGDFVLMAEDGGYFDDPDRPIAYSVSGKCWVNNHAHILQPGKEMNIHYLEWALKYRDITNVINGTTRSKLTQAAMRSISILLPPMDLQESFSKFLIQVDKSKFAIQQHLVKTMNTTAGVTNDS